MENKKRYTIGIMTGNTVSEYSEELMEGFRTCAKEENVNLVFFTGPYLPQYSRDILNGSFAWDYEYQFHTVYDYVHYIKPDAIIVAYGSLASFPDVLDVDEFVARFAEIPCLVLGDRVDDPKIPYLTGGNYHGMRKCIEHLICDHGYKKIGFVAGPARNFDSNQRLRAYKDAMQEHGLPIRDSMIVHGNYTETADAQAEQLLDQNPGIEAIAFANDSMAKAGYRVCAARDLVVGHDIAITGYDDGDIVKTLEPPLTSVAHSSFLFSYTAVQAALKLCRGEMPESEDLEAHFHRRASCGCKPAVSIPKPDMSVEDIKTYTEKRVADITEDLFSSIPYEKEKSRYQAIIDLYFADVICMVFENKGNEVSTELLLRYLKKMCEYKHISRQLLMESLEGLLKELMEFAEDRRTQSALWSIESAMQQYIHAAEVTELQTEILQSDRKNWFIPSFTMDLINGKLDMREQMLHIMKRLQAMGVKSAQLLFFQETIIHKKGECIKFPEKMYLTAYFDENGMICHRAQDLIPIEYKKGFTHLFPQDRAHFYTAFPLFSGEEQYGLILCEAEQKEYLFMLLCSMQLGSLRRIVNINMRERQMTQELEEKNRILNFISSYDEMSQLLNRRGFMEKAIQTIRREQGKHAYLLFADVDHLKEINDTFGHAAGDFAIQKAAEYLRLCLPANAVTARIGGDEFVSLIVTDCGGKEGCEILTRRLEKYALDYNKTSDRPFYVEISAGIFAFVCEENTDISKLLCQTDSVLYEKKKKRRSTIRKED